MRGYVKICGITTVDDAKFCVEAGVSAIGLNLWPGSSRCVSLEAACTIANAVRDSLEIVAVVVNPTVADLSQINDALAPTRLQLHGDEPLELLRAFLPRAFKAVPLATLADVERANKMPGAFVLVDAAGNGLRGGTGQMVNLALAKDVAQVRPTVLAGGLTPGNVAEAIGVVLPYGVDVASGVEVDKGVKDPAKVSAFVRAARQAYLEIADV